jgi:putative ATPase
VYVLKSLEKTDLEKLLQKALTEDFELKKKSIKIVETNALFLHSGGDARKLLNILDLIFSNEEDEYIVTDELVTNTLQQKIALYDKNGEQHYDIISAFIKSVRGSDPNAAVYWLARMIEGGEDVKFIARRLLILAAEDIGLANPNALLLANACFNSVTIIGLPEARIILSEATIYLATSPKSNSAYSAIDDALQLVRETGNLPVPLPLRNAPTKLMKQLGYGKDYKYAHSYIGNFVEQEFLPDDISGRKFYEPQRNAAEVKAREQLKIHWKKYEY